MSQKNSKKKISKKDQNASNKKAVSEQKKESVKKESIKDNIHFWRILSVVSIVLLCVSICGNALLLSPLVMLIQGSSEEIAGISQNQSLPYEVTYNGCGYENPYADLNNRYLRDVYFYVDLTFTNNSGEDASFILNCTADAYQNGVKIRQNNPWAPARPDVTDIQSGYSIQIKQYYELRDNSPVNLKVTDKDGNVLLEQTIDLPN